MKGWGGPDTGSGTGAPLWRRVTLRDVGVGALLALGLILHSLYAEHIGWGELAALAIGLAAGLWLDQRRRPLLAGDHHTTRVVAQDINTLRQAFGVLQQQVQATIRTSEEAVMSMMERMHRVHRSTLDLRERIVEAVQRSQSLSTESLDRAGRHGVAISTLAEHQARFEAAQRENHQRVRAVADRVRDLEPLVATISGISRQTNLLAINANIEAARAGPQGAGFKIVATEVRRLSTLTADAAEHISTGIRDAAAAIDVEMAAAQRSDDEGSAEQLGEIARHIESMSHTLGDVVPYLGQLSGHMDGGMAVVTEDIINTLGDMQFQDINRQLLEQISQALGALSEHFAQVYRLIDGDAPPPPVQLEELLARWTDNYVMHAQRVAHMLGSGGTTPEASAPVDAPAPDSPPLASAHGPRIELF